MGIFDVINANKRGCFISASDPEDAVAVALKLGHIHKRSSARVHDITANVIEDPGIKEIMAEDHRGKLAKQLAAYTVEEVLRGVKKGAGRWLLMVPVN